jgi:hypothetical protein
MAGGKVEEAIEKLFAMQELEAVSLSYAHTVSAQQKADLEAFRAATRERALTMYNHVKTVEAGEKGKGTVVRFKIFCPSLHTVAMCLYSHESHLLGLAPSRVTPPCNKHRTLQQAPYKHHTLQQAPYKHHTLQQAPYKHHTLQQAPYKHHTLQQAPYTAL